MTKCNKAKPKPAKRAQKVRKRPLKRMGRAHAKAVRWTLMGAQREFGMPRIEADRRRRALFIQPGEDGMFSTQQICAMAFGDKQRADIQTAQENAIAAKRRNDRESGELIATSLAVSLVEPIMVIIRQKICASSMTEAEKDEILADLYAMREIDFVKAAREAKK